MNIHQLDTTLVGDQIVIVGADFMSGPVGERDAFLHYLKRLLFITDLLFVSTQPDYGSNVPDLIDAVSTVITSNSWRYQFKSNNYGPMPSHDYLQELRLKLSNSGCIVTMAIASSHKEARLYRQAKFPVMLNLYSTINL